MIAVVTRAVSPGMLRAFGILLALLSVIAPALPAGWLFQQPPFPLAVLWAAYAWAAEDENGVAAPIGLAILGLIHDQFSGGPFGLFVTLYLSAYLTARGVVLFMSAPNLQSLWGGFLVTCIVSVAIAAGLANWALGANAAVRGYAETAAITVLLFPLARPLFMSATPTLRSQSGPRR